MEIELRTGTSSVIQLPNGITKQELECLRTVYNMMEGIVKHCWNNSFKLRRISKIGPFDNFVLDDITMKRLRQFSREELVLISIRSYKCNATSVFRMVMQNSM